MRNFEGVAAFIDGNWTVTGDGGEAERLSGARVTPEFFDVLGVHPALGREFSRDEYRNGREMEVIFSNAFWRRRYGGDPGIPGRRVTLDGIPYVVAGVMPAGFPLESQHDMWAPEQQESPYITTRRWRVVRAFGRLKRSDGIDAAQREASALAGDLAQRYPEDKGLGLRLTGFLEREVGGVRQSLWVFAAAVGCVLLIACANVASLLLARGAARIREMAVRTAVGATRMTLIAQLLTENILLAMVGAALGLPLAIGGVRLLVALDPRALPRAGEIRADPRMLLFALAASLVTGLIFGIVPALRGSRVSLSEALKETSRGGSSGRRGNRLRASLVVIEVALGVVLLSSAGLIGRSLRAMTLVDPGYRVDNVLSMQITLTGAVYRDAAACRRFFDLLETALQRIPGVESEGGISVLPLKDVTSSSNVFLDAQPHTEDAKIRVDNRIVTPGYFQTLGVPLVAGRFFEARDGPDAPHVVMINDTFAREFFPRGDAIGRRVTIEMTPPWVGEIVGVVRGYRDVSLAESPRRELFTAYSQTTLPAQTLVVGTKGDAAAYARAIRTAVASIDPAIPVYDVKTMRQQVDESLAQARLRSALLAVFSGIALVLASLGLYGMIACVVTERRQEIGIRMALGARAMEVRRMVVGQALKLTGIGLAAGAVGSAIAARLVENFLYGVSAADPATYAATVAIFLAVTVVASFLPAHRATRVNPLTVLRDE
jgi:predicted permease